MQNNWRDFVHFSSSEKRGIIVLVFLAVLMTGYNHFVPKWVSQNQIKKFEAKYSDVLAQSRNKKNTDTLKVNAVQYSNQHSATPSKSEKSGTNIEKVDIAETKKTSEIQQILDLNKCTAKQLMARTNIPAEVAYRIIKFRNGLGGFYTHYQLKDVFGITENIYTELQAATTLKQTGIQKIYINKASTESLQQHSYISEKLANQIVNFREKVKPFQTPEDVLKLYMVDEKLHKKLMPYIAL